MFVLFPDGGSPGAGGPAGGGALSQKLYFFGQLGIYFGILHAIAWYMNPSEPKKIENK
jgi:hypothetical protein